jgi:hypothetical protein
MFLRRTNSNICLFHTLEFAETAQKWKPAFHVLIIFAEIFKKMFAYLICQVFSTMSGNVLIIIDQK